MFLTHCPVSEESALDEAYATKSGSVFPSLSTETTIQRNPWGIEGMLQDELLSEVCYFPNRQMCIKIKQDISLVK